MEHDDEKSSARIAAALIREHRLTTPFLFLDEGRIAACLDRFVRHLPGVRLIYAMKANPSPEIVGYLASKGLSFDVASAGEIELVSRFGVPGDCQFLSTPMKTIETIDSMFTMRVGSCSVDTLRELDRIEAHRARRRYAHRPNVFVRLRVESRNVGVDLNTKFGCSIPEAIGIVERAAALGYTVRGICFHVGTQSTNGENYFLGVRSARIVAEEALGRFGIRIPVINIGGGFCDCATAARIGVDAEEYYREIGRATAEAQAAGYEVYAEPGRSLVASAGVLVTSVVGTNVRNGRRWAYLDDGIYGCYSLKLYENPSFTFIPVKAPGRRFTGSIDEQHPHCSWTLAGPTCDSLDVVAEDVFLPESLADGDLVVTPHLGAYSLSTASRFNGFRAPECYLIRAQTAGSSRIKTSLLRPSLLATEVPVRPSRVGAARGRKIVNRARGE